MKLEISVKSTVFILRLYFLKTVSNCKCAEKIKNPTVRLGEGRMANHR